jgi:hypothetical protein
VSPNSEDVSRRANSIPPRAAARKTPLESKNSPTFHTRGDQKRFIGDLNPEGIFVQSDKTKVNRSGNQRIGVWVQLEQAERETSSLDQEGEEVVPQSTTHGVSRFLHHWMPDPMMEKFLLPYLEEKCLSLLPPSVELSRLFQVYVKKIQPWFPIVTDSTVPSEAVVNLGIYLMTLQISGFDNGTKRERDTIQSIISAIVTLLDFRMVNDSSALARLYTILFLFGEGMLGSDRAAEYCNLAVHHIQSSGLHLDGNQLHLESIFLCVWIIDRLNAAIHGRPVLMHERDIGLDIEASISRQMPCFQLFLRLVLELDSVINLYRPNGKSNSGKTSLVSFDEIETTSGTVESLVEPHIIGKQSFWYGIELTFCV